MTDALIAIAIVGMLFIGLPWLIFHYTTQWRRAGTISREDEDLLDELHELGRRLSERMISIERIIAADNPDWRPSGSISAPRRPVEDASALPRLHAVAANRRIER